MASKKEAAPLRGVKLIKKAVAAAAASGLWASPEPMSGALAKKLVLPNGEPISPAMKALLTADAAWLGVEYDDEEGEIEGMSLEDFVEEALGEEALAAFGEAYEMFTEDVVMFGADLARPAGLYCGTPDDDGEYPVIELSLEGGVARIGGFVPFDVWAAQALGAADAAKELGDVPAEYAALPKAAADANGDGRVVFTPKAGEAAAGSDDDDSE